MTKTRMAVLATVWMGVLSSPGCTPRTTLKPVSREQVQEEYRGEKHCQVHHFDNAADLPGGSKPLGVVQVEQLEAGDEATQELLIQRVCERGGDAYTHPAWVQEPGMDKPSLRANAWAMPDKKE